MLGVTGRFEQGIGSRDGGAVRALASHQCGPGLILSRCPMWVESVGGFCLALSLFSLCSPDFLNLQKPTSPNKS